MHLFLLVLPSDMSTDPQLVSNIRSSTLLLPHIRAMSITRASSPLSSVGTPRSHQSHPSYQDTESGENLQEVQLLSRRILEFVDGDLEGIPGSVPGSHLQPGSSIGSTSGRDDELRRSVREALTHH